MEGLVLVFLVLGVAACLIISIVLLLEGLYIPSVISFLIFIVLILSLVRFISTHSNTESEYSKLQKEKQRLELKIKKEKNLSKLRKEIRILKDSLEAISK